MTVTLKSKSNGKYFHLLTSQTSPTKLKRKILRTSNLIFVKNFMFSCHSNKQNWEKYFDIKAKISNPLYNTSI